MTCMRVEGVGMVPYAEILEDRDGPKSDPKTLWRKSNAMDVENGW